MSESVLHSSQNSEPAYQVEAAAAVGRGIVYTQTDQRAGGMMRTTRYRRWRIAMGLVAGLVGMPASAEALPEVGGHLLIMVDDMPQALQQAKDAGFSVMHGTPGDSPDNAFIHMQNGWIVEPIDSNSMPGRLRVVFPVFRLVMPRVGKRIQMWLRAEPWTVTDWSVDAPRLEEARATMVAQGLKPSQLMDFDRVQANGELTTWQLVLPRDHEDPFLKGPYTNHIDTTPFLNHDNGLRSLVALTLTTTDTEQTVQRLIDAGIAMATSTDDVLCVQGVQVHIEHGAEHALGELVFSASVTASEQRTVGALGFQVVPAEPTSACAL